MIARRDAAMEFLSEVSGESAPLKQKLKLQRQFLGRSDISDKYSLFMLCTNTPICMISFLGYKEPLVKKKQAPVFKLLDLQRKKAESYAHLLQNNLGLTAVETDYNPLFLDDPSLKPIRHKTVITLPCFLGSIIQPSKPSDDKKELNDHFRETHPTIDASITLSQIRSVKVKMLDVGCSLNMELSSVASAYVYFEKLVTNNTAKKENRKLLAAVCMLLAAKVNDPKETNYGKLIEALERTWEVPKKDIYASEFSIFASLDFNLFLPYCEVSPHLDRIFASMLPADKNYTPNKTVSPYLMAQ